MMGKSSRKIFIFPVWSCVLVISYTFLTYRRMTTFAIMLALVLMNQAL